MADITVTLRGPMDKGLGRTDSLIAELEELGEVDVVERIEKRRLPTAAEVETALVIYLATKELLKPVVRATRRWVNFRFRAQGEPERTAVIYGPDGEVLSEVRKD